MERDKGHFCHYFIALLLWFEENTDSETYSESVLVSVKTCKYRFRWFKSDGFDLKDKERLDQRKKFEDAIAGIVEWKFSNTSRIN